jgi:hypothetical protein
VLDQTARLTYLYVGSADVEADLELYKDQLGGKVVWRSKAFDTEVAAVELGEGPLLLLADHEPAPGVILIWSVEDLDRAVAGLKNAGWRGRERRVEVPDGPCLLLTDASGNRIGLLQQTRPNVMLKE